MNQTGYDLILFLFIAIPILLVVLLIGMSIVGWVLATQLAHLIFIRLTGQEADWTRSRAEELIYPSWLKTHYFEWARAYYSEVEVEDSRPGRRIKVKIHTCAWKQRNEHRYICVHVATSGIWVPTMANVDIYSLYGESHSITTAGSDSGPMYPNAPGRYKQLFKTKRISELWDLHHEAEEILEPIIPEARNRSDCRPLEEVFAEHIRDEVAYLRTIRLWPLRIPWWFLVNRYLNINKTVVEQMSREEKKRLGIKLGFDEI